MGAIKEKMFEIAEIIQQMMDEGVKDFEVDEYLESQLTPEDYQFYHQNKDVIFQHFLGYMGESLTPSNPHINRNIEQDDPRWVDPHEWDRHRRFKENELAHELAGEDECPTCGRQLDDSGHCRKCEKRNESEFMMPSIFDKNLNEESRYNIPYQGFGEEPDEDTIRVFKNKTMKAYDSKDYAPHEIKLVNKTYTVEDSFGDEYFVTAVLLSDGNKGYVWPDVLDRNGIDPKTDKRNKFDESKKELMMPSLFEGCGCGKKRVSSTPVRRPAPPVKLPIPPKSPNPRLK